MKERADELSSTISVLRDNVASLEEKMTKEESDKLVGYWLLMLIGFFVPIIPYIFFNHSVIPCYVLVHIGCN